MESIMPTQRGVCYICGAETYTECHHCFHGTANRKIAEQEGLKVWLCHECHRSGKHAVHRCKSTDLFIEQEAQNVWEERYIIAHPEATIEGARTAFMKLFGKSYIYD